MPPARKRRRNMDARGCFRGGLPTVVAKPAGGFRPIGVQQLLDAWTCYRTGLLRKYLDFRVYLALHEIHERRLAAQRIGARCGRRPQKKNGPERDVLEREVMVLVHGTSLRLVRSALRRIQQAGLASIGETGIAFPPSETRWTPLDSTMAPMRRAVIAQKFGTRRVPVPRRMLRYLAYTASPSVAATALGQMIHTLHWEGTVCRIRGMCTVRQVSDLFGVHSRSVKRARAHLRVIGWFVGAGEQSGDFAGDSMMNLVWTCPSIPSRRQKNGGTALSPFRANLGTDMSPPTSMIQLRTGCTHQPPASGRVGVKRTESKPATPGLPHLEPADLDNPERLAALFGRAVRQGLVRQCAGDRLKFFAAAERAKRVSTQNRCGFFAAFIRRGLWDFLSQADEDRAIERIRGCERWATSRPDPRPEHSSNAAQADPDAEGRDGRAKVRLLITQLASRFSSERPTRHRADCAMSFKQRGSPLGFVAQP
jgi:hypothetical protein